MEKQAEFDKLKWQAIKNVIKTHMADPRVQRALGGAGIGGLIGALTGNDLWSSIGRGVSGAALGGAAGYYIPQFLEGMSTQAKNEQERINRRAADKKRISDVGKLQDSGGLTEAHVYGNKEVTPEDIKANTPAADIATSLGGAGLALKGGFPWRMDFKQSPLANVARDYKRYRAIDTTTGAPKLKRTSAGLRSGLKGATKWGLNTLLWTAVLRSGGKLANPDMYGTKARYLKNLDPNRGYLTKAHNITKDIGTWVDPTNKIPNVISDYLSEGARKGFEGAYNLAQENL
jgi:hypothetical protein